MVWQTLHHTSHFKTDVLARDCEGVVSRILVHGAGTKCTSIYTGQELAVSKPAYTWLSDSMKVPSLSVDSTVQGFVLHYRKVKQQCIPR